MWTTLFLLVGLMIATAVIAYWSDNLGKKLGKKRVTLGGLRPKQTATLITIASSLVIMLVTFGTMLIVYQPLQDALFSFDRVRADKTRFEQQNTLLSGDIERLKVQENTLRKSINQAQNAEDAAEKAKAVAEKAKNSALKSKNDAEKAKNDAVENERKAIENARNAKQREENAKRGEADAKRGVENAKRDLENAQKDYADAKKDLSNTKAQLKPAQDKLKKAQDTLKTAQDTLKAAQDKLKTTQDKLKVAQTAVDKAQELTAKQGSEILTQQASLFDLENSVKERQQELETANQQLKDARGELQKVTNALTEFRELPVIVTAGETLAQQFIAPRLDESTVTNLLRDLMRQTRQNVQRIGERNGRLGLKTQIVERSGADEEEQIRIIAASLAQSITSNVVRVFALRNHTVGSSNDDAPDIETAFVVLPVNIAYRRDEVIATSNIDGRLGDAQIFNRLLRLLDDGERAARSTQKRVQPPLGGDNKFYAEGTNERLFEALNAIKLLKSNARVSLRAAEDLTTTAPPQVRFEVLPAS